MATKWHHSKGFEPLATRLFIGASYASAMRYPTRDRDVIDIGLRVIDSFKEYWSVAIALVNQTAAPALQHGYGMAAVDNDASNASYTKKMMNFGAAYAATQDTMKSQAASLAAMQGQLANTQQFCMAVGQQPPSSIYQPPSNSYALVHNSTRPTTVEEEAEAEAVADMVAATNNQPGMVLADVEKTLIYNAKHMTMYC